MRFREAYEKAIVGQKIQLESGGIITKMNFQSNATCFDSGSDIALMSFLSDEWHVVTEKKKEVFEGVDVAYGNALYIPMFKNYTDKDRWESLAGKENIRITVEYDE